MTSVAELLAQGQQHHQAGRLAQAEQCYRRALEINRESAAAWGLLGAACLMQGRFAEAVNHCQTALLHDPNHAAALDNMGIALASAGRPEEALCCFLRALWLNPRSATAHYNLGGAYLRLDRLKEAEHHFHAATFFDSGQVEAHYHRAEVLVRLGRTKEAVPLLRRVLELRPGHAGARQRLASLPAEPATPPPTDAEVIFQRGTRAVEQGRLAEGVALLRQAVQRAPGHVAAHYNLAVALARQGRLDEAAAALQETLRLQPDHADAHNCLGMVRAQERRFEEAIVAFQESLRRKPHNPEALSNLGIACWELDRRNEALASFQEAVRLKPDMVAGHTNLAIALTSRGEPEQAADACARALVLSRDPATRVLDAFLLPIIYRSREAVGHWRHRLTERLRELLSEGVQTDITQEPPPTLFYLAYQGHNDRDLMRDAARLFRAPPDATPPRPLAHGGRRARVAFLSCYLRNHTIGELMRGLIARLSRRDFEVTVLTPVRHDDEVSRFIKENCDRYIELPFGLEAQRRAIRELAPDVLFYTDVGMDRVTYALAFSRLAPVQCVTWGHPSTTGSPAIDYFVSSALFEAEEANEHYTEALVRLRSMPFWCNRPDPPAAPKTREQLGLPPDTTIYGCPQSLFKLHPEFDALLAGVLRADPRGRVVLNQDRHPFYGHWEKLLRERFAVSMPDVADRVLFLPRLSHADYLSLNLATDVLLDPLHFTGGNTSLKALALGVPIVTLPGALLKSRMTAAFYRRMGVTDAIARAPEEYVRLAVRLGTEPEARRALSRKIREANAVLYDNAESARDLEEFLHQAVARAR